MLNQTSIHTDDIRKYPFTPGVKACVALHNPGGRCIPWLAWLRNLPTGQPVIINFSSKQDSGTRHLLATQGKACMHLQSFGTTLQGLEELKRHSS